MFVKYTPVNKSLEVLFRLKMSPWIATNSLVTALLQNKGYTIEYNTPHDAQAIPGIDFIGRKPK